MVAPLVVGGVVVGGAALFGTSDSGNSDEIMKNVGFDHPQKYGQIQNGKGTGGLHTAISGWQQSISADFDEVATLLDEANSKAGVAWTGQAAEQHGQSLKPMSNFVRDSKEISQAVGDSASQQATAFGDVRNGMPEPPKVDATDSLAEKGGAWLVGGETDLQEQERKATEKAQEAKRIYETYDQSIQSNSSGLPRYPEPPKMSYEQGGGTPGGPSQQVNGTISPGSGGTGGGGIGGSSGTTTPSGSGSVWTPSPSGPVGTPAPTPTPSPGPSPTPSPAPGPVPSPTPGPRGPGNTGPTGPGNGKTGPGSGNGRSGTGGSRGLSGGSRGVAGGGVAGGSSGSGGSNQPGAGGRSGSGALSGGAGGRGGPAGTGAAGGGARGGGAGPMGGGARGRGQEGEEDLEHENKYMLPTDEAWEDLGLPKVAPPVLGDWNNQNR